MLVLFVAACGFEPPAPEPEPSPIAAPVPREGPPLAALAPPTAQLATYREMWEDARAPRHPSDGGGRLVDAVVPDDLVADGPAALSVALEVGPFGIATGGAVTVTASPFWGWTPAAAAARIEGPADAALDVQGVAGMLVATVRGRALQPGERLRITYGEGGTARADRFAERAPALWVAVDGDGDGVRAVVDAVEAVVRPGAPAAIVATLPSVAAPGDVVALRIAAVDRAGNGFGDPGDQADVALRGSPGLDLPARARLDREGLATVEVRVREAGVHVVEAAGPTIAGRSNPLVARAGAEPILWGDLQVHTAISDGTGRPADVLRYARDVAGLDVAAVTDHDRWGMRFLDATPALRQEIAGATDTLDAPGRFVAVHGFEWTSWVWGHRHVLWFDAARPPLSSLDPAFDTPEELHAALRGQPAVVIRHHPAGGPIAVDPSTPLDPALEPVIEIVSVHGQSESPSLPGAIYDAVPEAFVERLLANGVQVGLIGSTDGHDGHPGLSQLAGGQGGLVALLGAERTRGSVLQALRERRVYATNGPRIVLRVDVAGVGPGGTVAAQARAPVTVRVVGTAPIERVELVNRAGVVGSRSGDGSALLFAEIPADLRPGDLLYVRVVQQDGGLAWSSPVAVAP